MTAIRIVDCPFGVAADYTRAFLRDADERPLLRVRCLVRDLAAPATLRWCTRADLTEWGKPHDEIACVWEPASPLLPSFEIVLRFRIRWMSTAIVAHASYRAPAALRWALRNAAGRRAALRAANDVLQRLAENMERRERAFRAASPVRVSASPAARSDTQTPQPV